MSNYAEIIKKNLEQLYSPIAADLADRLPAQQIEDGFILSALG
jgi:hypothetical protein